jgi:hypothetical protein
MTITRQATGDTTNLPFIQYNARVQRDSGNTSTATPYFIQAIETVNTIPLAGKTITVSFYARRGANFSATSNLLKLQSFTGTGTDQDPTSFAYTGQVEAIQQTFTLTTTWQRFSTTVTIGATVTEMDLLFSYNPTGTAGAADYYDLTGVQLEVGSTATPFSRAGGTIQGELAACQRYYWRFIDGVSQWVNMAAMFNAGQLEFAFRYVVPMRVAPTLIASTGTSEWNFSRNGASDPFNSLTLYQATTQSCLIYNNSEISGTAGHAGNVYSNQATSSAALSAEL